MRRAVHAKAANAFAGIGSTAVFQLRAFMADRVGRPSWSAGSVSRSVNPARSCLHRLTAKAAGHVTLRNGVPSMTKDEKEKTHVDAIIERYKDLMVEIPRRPATRSLPALAGSRPARHRQGRPPGRELACRPDRRPALDRLRLRPRQPAHTDAEDRLRSGLPDAPAATPGSRSTFRLTRPWRMTPVASFAPKSPSRSLGHRVRNHRQTPPGNAPSVWSARCAIPPSRIERKRTHRPPIFHTTHHLNRNRARLRRHGTAFHHRTGPEHP